MMKNNFILYYGKKFHDKKVEWSKNGRKVVETIYKIFVYAKIILD